MRDFVSDIRFAVRMLVKNPGFTGIAVLALALGIGANTAIFSVVNAVILRPLPYDGAERLVSVLSVNTKRSMTEGATSYPDFHDYREQSHSFEQMIAFHDDSWALTGPGRQASNLSMAIVSAGMFPMLGVKPLLGRVFRADEDENVGAPMTIVLSHAAWQKQFGGDPGIVGRSILLRGRPFAVAGVMPAGFNFPVRNEPFEAWTTFAFATDLRTDDGTKGLGQQRGAHYLETWGKLKPGVSMSQAKAELDVITAQLASKYPNSNKYRGIRIVGAIDYLTEHMRPVLLILLGAVGCVLLVACANVANLLLVRATARHREIAIRAALGASRFRVIRQVLTESVLLAVLGGVAGLGTGAFASDLLIRFSPANVPRLGQAQIDASVFLFALGLALLTGILFGMAPALRASQADPSETLKEGSRGTTEGIGRNKARSALIVVEVALALMLLASAGLLIRSLDRLNHVQPGFRSDGVLSAALTFPGARYKDPQIISFLDRLEAKLQQSPGVTSASDVLILPLSGNDINTSFQMEGHPVAPADEPSTRANVVGVRYFQTMGIPLLSGRDFTEGDGAKSADVVMVNDVFVKEFLPGVDPIGKSIKPGLSKGEKDPMRRIIGVVASNTQDRIGAKVLPEVFIPRNQFPNNGMAVVVHTQGDARAAVPALRDALRELDADMPIDELRTMRENVDRSLAQPRFEGFLLAIFAALALLLTAVGLYGVISYSVAQRTREIGTRMALGAQHGNIIRLVVGQSLALTTAGVVAGLAGSFAVSRLLASQLYEVAPTDPLTLAAITVLIFCVSLLASFVPAWRAAAIDPMIALRYE